jgi:hypothetical protein
VPCRVAVVGVTGYGRQHLANVSRLGLPLAGVCDIRPVAVDAPVYQDLGLMLAECEPDVTIVATPIHTHADLRYEQDELNGDRFERVDQPANLASGGDPLCPLAATRAFTGVVEAIRDADDPAPIDPRHWRQVGARRVVTGVDAAVRRAAGELKLFSEQGITWKGRP